MPSVGQLIEMFELESPRRGDSCRPAHAVAAVSYEGVVQYGAKLGRTIGFPTANIEVVGATPEPGIYAAHVLLEGGRHELGVAYFGSRPTVDGKGELLEVNLFGFSDDIYGLRLRVTLVGKIRDDVKFASLELMVEQMERDRLAAIDLLRSVPAPADEATAFCRVPLAG